MTLRAGSRLLLASLLGAACQGAADPAEDSAQGSLTVEWSGSQRGVFTGPAEARWCPTDTVLEIIAARSDTGVGLALFATDSAGTTDFPVSPAYLFVPWRPQAGAALRWLGATEVLAFDGSSGRITIARSAGGRVSGRVEAMLRIVSRQGPDSIRLTGGFQDVRVRPAALPCGRTNRPGG
ncbi:MAG: hypothetical protein ACRENB_09980 [Gemmatimonadales bacterium]